MNSISFERILITLLLIAAVAGLAANAVVVASLGLIALDAFKFYVANKKQTEASQKQIADLTLKIDQIEKSVNDKMSLVDNKVAGLGLSRRNG